jgi:hypothetical protein
MTVDPRKCPVLLVCLFCASDPDIFIFNEENYSTEWGFSGIIEREHMGRISKTAGSYQDELMFCFSYFAGKVTHYVFVSFSYDYRKDFSS